MLKEDLKTFGTLQSELEQAKISLKDVDEHIKRLIGRDPSEALPRSGAKRPGNFGDDARMRKRTLNTAFNSNRGKQNYDNDSSARKRNLDSSVYKRLSEKSKQFEDEVPEPVGKQLISKVIVTPKEVLSRQEVLAAQSADEKSKARNRRMFGALLGTLQKFRQEETKLKPKEEKRAQVEKKLEEQQIKEKEELKKERQDLFWNRKRKQAEIRMIELKMTRMKEHAEWEDKQKPLMNYIQTKTKPHIFFLPKILNNQNKVLLESCQKSIEKSIDRKRQDVYEELNAIEQKMRRNFSNRKQQTPCEEVEKPEDENPTEEHENFDENEDHCSETVTEGADKPAKDNDDDNDNDNDIDNDHDHDNENDNDNDNDKNESEENCEAAEQQEIDESETVEMSATENDKTN